MGNVKIKQFSDKNKELIAGLTPEHAVYDVKGVRLDAKIGSILDIKNTVATQGKNLDNLTLKVNALAVGIFYGYRANESELPQDITERGYAYVGTDNPYKIYNFDGTQWKDSGTTIQATSEADEEDITYNENDKLTFKDRNNTNGMGYIILRKNKTFAEQVTKENTIYEIRYKFDLNGTEVIIPNNCILKFVGGVLSNGNINGNHTIIDGLEYKLFNSDIVFSGTWKGVFNITWLGLIKDDIDYDNSPIIQKALRSFIYTYIPNGTYYCKTSIECTSHTGEIHYTPMYFNCEGELYYTKKDSSDTFIQIGSSGGKIYIASITGSISNPYNNIEKSTGLSLYDCNQCDIHIGNVSGFYRNIEILGGSLGFAYNNIKINSVGNAIIGIHLNCITGGWVNSNKFQIFRMYWFAGQLKMNTAILAKADDSAYASYNDTLIERLSIENLKNPESGAPIKLYNCSDFRIENYRNEDDNVPFVETHDNCKNIHIIPNYYSHNTKTGFSIASIDGQLDYTEPLKHRLSIKPFSNGYMDDKYYYSKDVYTIDLSNKIPYNTPGYMPMMVLFKKINVINNPIILNSIFKGNVYIAYYNSNKQLLNKDDYLFYKPITNGVIKEGAVDSRVFMKDGATAWTTINIPTLPDEIEYVAIGTTINSDHSDSIDSSLQFEFYSNICIYNIPTKGSVWTEYYKDYKAISGNSNNRPEGYIGQQYFDKTLNKPIWYNGTKWVDSTGTDI